VKLGNVIVTNGDRLTLGQPITAARYEKGRSGVPERPFCLEA
jgi:hypothetical protein